VPGTNDTAAGDEEGVEKEGLDVGMPIGKYIEGGEDP